MLFYKFLNDAKGELSQVLIAAQSPNKVSKRVILDVSIEHCAKSIADAKTDIPLRMRALLLLGLSRILNKKSQLLINDCYRIQSAIGDVMSISSNDLPKEMMIASDQQITLNSSSAPRTALDVDVSFDHGDMVDRWIDANFSGDLLTAESYSGSLNVSFDINIDDMVSEVEVRRQSQTMVMDDLYPGMPALSNIGNSLMDDTIRGDDSLHATTLLPAPTSLLDVGNDPMGEMDYGMNEMDLEPIEGDSVDVSDAIMRRLKNPYDVLKPVDHHRKRRAVALDKSLELPMTGFISTRAKLMDALETARSKRRKLNNLRILLLSDVHHDSNTNYGGALKELLTPHQVTLNPVKTRTEPIPTVPQNDFEYEDAMEMDLEPLEGGMDDTLQFSDHSAHETVQSEPQRPTLNYEGFVSNVKQAIEDELVNNGERSLSWNSFTAGNDRHFAAANFFNLLIATTKQEINVTQRDVYGDIQVSLV